MFGPDIGMFNAINSKCAEILSQLAPTGEVTLVLNKPERDRPNDTLRGYTFEVLVGDQNLALFTHRLSQHCQINRLGLRLPMVNVEADVTEIRPQLGRKHRVNLGQQILRRSSETVVRLTTDPFDAKRKSLKLFVREHQGRQQKTRPQNIPDTWFPFDVCAHSLQACDVTTDSPQGDSRFIRKLETCHRPAMPAQDLHEVE